jgi:hypothetical protein
MIARVETVSDFGISDRYFLDMNTIAEKNFGKRTV